LDCSKHRAKASPRVYSEFGFVAAYACIAKSLARFCHDRGRLAVFLLFFAAGTIVCAAAKRIASDRDPLTPA
jgi:hypothetical protein